MIASANMHTHKAASAFGALCMLLALALVSSAPSAQSNNVREASAAFPACQGGYVQDVSGVVSMQRVAAKAVAAKVGDMFEAETIFRTGSDGNVILKFADGEVVALGPDSALRVGQYCYVSGSPGQSSSTIELMKGQMRFVTGLIGAANREGVRIIAGNTMIRILRMGGADFTVVVNPDPQEVGAVVVALGEISLRTPYGPISRIAAGQYAPWQPGRSPPLPMPFAAAPAVIQAGVAALWATVLPANTPVAVASAARTAGAMAAATQAQAAANADPRLAGYVEAISNTVSIQTTSGRTATANVGTTFEAGTTFNTGSDGRVVLKFADGQLVVLGPGSIFAVDQYRFDPGNVKASRSAIELANGGMRFITGYIHTENHDGVTISAGASIIDILNAGPADFTVVVDTKDQEVGIVRVTLGEISVHTPYGPIDKIRIDQSSLWGPGSTPMSPIPTATAPAVVQATVALQLSALPDNTPVAVASAARAAAATAEASRAQAVASANPWNAQLRAAAQAATELANAATQAATAAGEAVAAKIIAATLEALPPTAAGPAVAQVPATPTARAPIAPITPTAVTPGAGGACTGSPC